MFNEHQWSRKNNPPKTRLYKFYFHLYTCFFPICLFLTTYLPHFWRQGSLPLISNFYLPFSSSQIYKACTTVHVLDTCGSGCFSKESGSRSSPISSNIFNCSIQHISKQDSEWLYAFQKLFTGHLILSLFQFACCEVLLRHSSSMLLGCY